MSTDWLSPLLMLSLARTKADVLTLYIFYYYLQVASINFSLICICKCVNAADINFLHFRILLSNVSHG